MCADTPTHVCALKHIHARVHVHTHANAYAHSHVSAGTHPHTMYNTISFKENRPKLQNMASPIALEKHGMFHALCMWGNEYGLSSLKYHFSSISSKEKFNPGPFFSEYLKISLGKFGSWS